MGEIDINALLRVAARKGKRLSICAKITDTDKALEFMYTMHRKGEENEYGLVVSSWGDFDEVEALANKLNAIETENQRHRQAIDKIMHAPLDSFLNKHT